MVRKPQSIHKHTLYLLLLVLVFVVFFDWSGIFSFEATKLPFHIDRTLCMYTHCLSVFILLIDLLQNQKATKTNETFLLRDNKIRCNRNSNWILGFFLLSVWSFGSNNWFSMCDRWLECLKHTHTICYLYGQSKTRDAIWFWFFSLNHFTM